MNKITRPLTVLHIGTINKPIGPSNGYSPIETVIYNIDKGLHTLGHRSIVACSADSAVTGEQYNTVARSLGDYCHTGTGEGQASVNLHLARALARAQPGDIDIIHMHEWFEHVYDGRFAPAAPIVMTLHVPGNRSGLSEFRAKSPAAFAASRGRLHPVAISEYQRRQYGKLLPAEMTIPHGVAVDDYLVKREPNTGSYLFSIGRITEDKGQDIAITVARKSGSKLIIAGCVQDKEATAPSSRGCRSRSISASMLALSRSLRTITRGSCDRSCRRPSRSSTSANSPPMRRNTGTATLKPRSSRSAGESPSGWC